MIENLQQTVETLLNSIETPYLGGGLVDQKCLESLVVEGECLKVMLVLPFPAQGIAESLATAVREALAGKCGFEQIEVQTRAMVPSLCEGHALESIQGVKNIIAVASGKGGVGKSTTAVNLALALSAEGARVGLLDGDIYGPSQQIMLGIEEGVRPEQYRDQYLLPIQAHGLQTMSMGYLVTEKTPMVWRGPMVSGALQQMLGQTKWDDLDYLVIDMPPGTGDIQLTLSQKVPVTGAVIVTTPQDIALLDAIKGIEMFQKVDIPVLGVVENMAWYNCSKCGEREYLFGQGGGDKLAQEYSAPVLGSLPLTTSIREQVDAGNPTVIAEPDSEIAGIYRDIARQVGASIAKRAAAEPQFFPAIETSDD